jgi:hypothetical protein
MVQEDKNTKGWSFYPEFDSYTLVTDSEKLAKYVEKYGYWSYAVKKFNQILQQKGGYDYMTELNQKYVGTPNTKQS